MDRDSNRHTYLFAGIMVITIAFVLSFTSESLKEIKLDNLFNLEQGSHYNKISSH